MAVRIKTLFLKRRLQGVGMHLGTVINTGPNLDASALEVGVAIVWGPDTKNLNATLVPYGNIDNIDYFRGEATVTPIKAKSLGKKREEET